MFDIFMKRMKNKVRNVIYSFIVEQSRQPFFYIKYRVPDTPEGRLSMITIHPFLVFRLLKDKTTNFCKKKFDLIFVNIEKI